MAREDSQIDAPDDPPSANSIGSDVQPVNAAVLSLQV